MLTAKTYTNIDGAVLAGGKNSRFDGRIKAKLRIGKKSILANTLEILDSVFSRNMIITNYASEFKDYKHYPMVEDSYKDVGPLGGIHAALTDTGAEALFIVAGDMPELSVYLIRQMADYFVLADCEVLIPRINNNIEPLHAFYSKDILSRLDSYLASSDSYAIRCFLENVRVEYLDLNSDEDGRSVFTNINSENDLINYEKESKTLRKNKIDN